MKKIELSILIDAPPESVWRAITEDGPYRQWTRVFEPESHFKGGWNTGDEILFLGHEDEGKSAGMFSEIAVSRYPEFISIRHLGIVSNGIKDTESPEAKKWAPAYENYSITPISENRTRFSVESDIEDDFYDEFTELWKQALEALKDVAVDLIPPVKIEVLINSSLETVWHCWTDPKWIVQWNFASEDWHCPYAENDLRAGGRFRYTMAALSSKASFEFEGTYVSVVPLDRIHYVMDDNRQVRVVFISVRPEQTKVIEWFDPESENSIELQRSGWQAILNQFKLITEKQ